MYGRKATPDKGQFEFMIDSRYGNSIEGRVRVVHIHFEVSFMVNIIFKGPSNDWALLFIKYKSNFFEKAQCELFFFLAFWWDSY